MNNSTLSNRTFEKLPIFMCLLIDLPSKGYDCSTVNSSRCVTCKIRGDYLSGESDNAYNATGHLICVGLWLICVASGTFGLLGNSLIISVLKRRSTSDKGFDFLLIVLACFDIICCAAGLIASTCHVFYHGI